MSPSPERSPLELAAIERLFATGAAAHPDIQLDRATFIAHFERCAAPLSRPADLHGEDLFLVSAALAGNVNAIAKLQRNALSAIRSSLRRMRLSSAAIEDTLQELWSVLLLGRQSASPRLFGYAGTGSLVRFVVTAAQRIALTRFRRDEMQARVIARASAETEGVAHDLELGFMKTTYRADFRDAIEEALDTLDDRLRMVLRLQLIDNLTVDKIAQVYGVAQSSVSRWIAKAHEIVADATYAQLRRRLGLSEEDFDALWALVESQLDVSVARILASVQDGL